MEKAEMLDDVTVRSIRERYAAGGITGRQLAHEYGRSHAMIYFLLCGSTYKRAGGPIQPPRMESRARRPRPPLPKREERPPPEPVRPRAPDPFLPRLTKLV